jgi:hypothetical protein
MVTLSPGRAGRTKWMDMSIVMQGFRRDAKESTPKDSSKKLQRMPPWSVPRGLVWCLSTGKASEMFRPLSKERMLVPEETKMGEGNTKSGYRVVNSVSLKI